MRADLSRSKLDFFMRTVGLEASSYGRVYLVGGASALLLGIREQTVDLDLKLDPEPKGVFESIAALKERLATNVELAAPDQFLPELPGWRERSEFIARFGLVDFLHYDFYGQTLAKILRGHRHDLSDALAFVRLGKVSPARLQDLFDRIRGSLIRYPAINAQDFASKLSDFIRSTNP